MDGAALSLTHLTPAAQLAAQLPDDERIQRIRGERWIGYSRAVEALKRLEELYHWPARQRMPNLLLIGPTNNGKSMIIEKFRRDHPAISLADNSGDEIPVLAMQMPSDPTVVRFYAMLLAGLGAPGVPRSRSVDLEQLALRLMREVKVSVYATSIVDVIKSISSELLDDYHAEFNYSQQSRTLSEILEEENLLFRKVWYNRHWNLRLSIKDGKKKVVSKEDYSTDPYKPGEILDTVWAQALKAAKKTEKEVGVENLGPWDDFEWGMLNGKLSALRWVLGDEWDMLDT